MAKKKLDWKKVALYGGGGLFVLWLLKRSAGAAPPRLVAKAKASAKMLMGEPMMGRFMVDEIGDVKSCYDLRNGEYAPNIECDRQLTAPVTDANYWSKS